MVHFTRPFFHRQKSDEVKGSSKPGTYNHASFFLDNSLPLEYFKQDILKLTHKLHVPRWQNMVDTKMAGDIEVRRLSGALTNAIYCVEPPKSLRDAVKRAGSSSSTLPPKLLLRVYGPQVVHLIDRETELSTLARLSEQNIGPKIFGTFTNGRFEQFLDVKTLTKEDLRDPATSVQIAKRMRELHDGVPLLPEERALGPGAWIKIDKWSPKAFEKLRILEARNPGTIKRVLQVDSINKFTEMVGQYKAWVIAKYGGVEKIKEDLVFCHNDAQYGNLLRLEPPKGSPLLRPQNEHRQLVVIDFEYSGPNHRAFDIANHFCEWMSDYHHPELSYHIFNDRYPTKEQQEILIHSYVEHGIETFDEDTELKMQIETDKLMRAVVDWRAAVHLHWCLWGIVQNVIDVEDDLKKREELDTESGTYSFTTSTTSHDGGELSPVVDEMNDEEESFDYIAYSTEKAQLFWTEMIRIGLYNRDAYDGIIKAIAA